MLTKAIDLGSTDPQVYRAIASANFEMWKKDQTVEKFLINSHKYYEQCCRIMAKSGGNYDDVFQADVLYELHVFIFTTDRLREHLSYSAS